VSPAPSAAPEADTGSFRDPNARIYSAEGRILRGLGKTALDNFHALTEARFYRDFCGRGEIIATREVDPPPWAVQEPWAGWLEHDRVPAISYPYEWTFSMLRDAALLQLRLLEAALLEDWTMKDASPYNVQFVAGKPVFIDIPSLEPARPGSPWAGYRQFCELNLFPLMLQAYKGVDFQSLLRARINGIDVQTAAKLFGVRDRLRRGVFSHVWLQSLLDRKYGGTRRNLRDELGSAGFGRELVLANVRKLLRLVPKLEWADGRSEWADYADFHNYTAEDHTAKAAFVEQAAIDSGAQLTWDIGCNTGQFSLLAARHCPLVLAMDADHLAVERLYRDAGAMQSGRILPLVQNLADPSPSWGWNLQERRSLQDRARPDLALCLALLHHVVIGANVPLNSVLDWLHQLQCQAVIEFVDRSDDKVQTLLLNRDEAYEEYNRVFFEQSLESRFEVVRRQEISDGNRVLFYCRPLPFTL